MVRHALPVVRHATVSLPPVDGVAAAGRLGGRQWCWASPARGEHWAGFGQVAAVTAESVPEAAAWVDQLCAVQPPDPDAPPGPWVGGVAFDARRLWDGWDAARFVVPRGIFWARGGRWFATALALNGETALLKDTLATMVDAAAFPPPRFVSGVRGSFRASDDESARQQWDQLVARCLRDIGDGTLGKVVPARQINVVLPVDVDVARLMAQLLVSYPGCQSFLLTGLHGDLFAGATPETLCRVDGDDVRVDALAGSAPLHTAEQLLNAAKENAEHRFVVEAVVEGLRPLCADVQHPVSPSVLRLPNIAHLHTPVRARLRSGLGPGAVMNALHPTPAVAGTPRAAAMDLLLAHEDFSRGLYAGVVGLVGNGAAHLCVALRCAHVRGRNAALFAGAGVVKGSNAALEWEETARKSHVMRQALAEASHGAA